MSQPPDAPAPAPPIVPLLRHPSLDGLTHGFFTRAGGVSEGPYASLNCSMRSGDDPDRLRRNRGIVAAALGVGADQLLGATQVHGRVVAVADGIWPGGAGPEADALVSATPGLALGVITADCAPILLADGERGVVGAAHAGWRGAAAGIVEATVAAMRGLGAERIVAVVGPCIAQSSARGGYEVGPELREALLLADALLEVPLGAERWFRPGAGDRLLFDLPGYCLSRLAAAGVEAASIGLDTLSDPAGFFSHRRRTLDGGGAIGHQISAIVVPEPRSMGPA